MSKDLPAPTNSLSQAQEVWIINELGRTENKLSVQLKFKKTFGKMLPDPQIDEILGAKSSEIEELRKAHKNTIDTHEWGDPRTRMEKFKALADKAEKGIFKGIDKSGNEIIEEDLELARKCLINCREEQDRENKNNLELLKLMILMGKNGGIANISGAQATNGLPSDEVTDAEETGTDTDQYFE